MNKGLVFVYFSLGLFVSASVSAVTLEIVGPCSPAPVFKTSAALAHSPESLGKATLDILEQNRIPYQGYETGISSIYNTPTGDGSLEVLSDSEMRAYGWCYEINGKAFPLMPDKVMLSGSESIRWFYAFAYYKAGQWISYCTPAFTVRPAALCRR